MTQGAGVAVLLPGAVTDRSVLIDPAARRAEVAVGPSQSVASWADIAVLVVVVGGGRSFAGVRMPPGITISPPTIISGPK